MGRSGGGFYRVEVCERQTKGPRKEFCDELQIACFEKGVIIWRGGAYEDVIRPILSLVITKELMLNGLGTLKT